MQPVLSFHTKPDHVSVDACIVWCFDPRFSALLHAFERERGYAHTDIVKVAGGAKDLASPGLGSSREYLLGQIEASLRLHHAPRVILMMHDDCGAYGGRRGSTHYEAELRKARQVLETFLSGKGKGDTEIELLFCDFEGVSAL